MIEIRYAQIRSLDLSNGEGVGVALFVQGCHFKCKGCFNQETWDFNGGKEWTEEAKEKFLKLVDRPYIKRVSLLGGECLAEENLDDVLNLVTEINKQYNTTQDTVYVKDKNNNILTTFPNKIRLSSPQKSIWLYTGYRVKEIYKDHFGEKHFILSPSAVENWIKQPEYKTTIENGRDRKRSNIIKQCNILVDDQYVESQRDITIPWVGSSNQRVISVKESLQKGEIVLWQT